jgi:hypothetical protein
MLLFRTTGIPKRFAPEPFPKLNSAERALLGLSILAREKAIGKYRRNQSEACHTHSEVVTSTGAH